MARKYPPIVSISWVDAQSMDTSLLFPEEIPDEPVICKIVGFLVKETKTDYFLASEAWETGQCKYIHVIPKRSVIRKRKY